MQGFSSEVQHLLLEAGWYAGRQVDALLYAPGVLEAGYAWTPAATNFLREFGGLRLNFLRADGSLGMLHFDPLIALGYQTPAQVQHYTDHLAPAALCLIGQAYAEHLILLMDEAGTVYGSFEDMVYEVGTNGAAAIEAVCLDLPFREL